MKVICGFFGIIFGLTGFSCFYNLAIGRYPSPPLVLFFLGIFSFGITALCIWGIKHSIDKGKESGSSATVTAKGMDTCEKSSTANAGAQTKGLGGNVIVKTKIIDTYGKTSTVSAAARGTVGGIVAGPVGSIVGASTAKNKRSTTFLILYKSGKKITRAVPNNSLEYQKYVKYLDV